MAQDEKRISLQPSQREQDRDEAGRSPSRGPPDSEGEGEDEDFYSVAGAATPEWKEKERRPSATSASTATARSFRQLHRRYSRSASTAGRLSAPSDGESDAAVSFSEGGPTPLPPIDPESGGEEGPGAADERVRSGYFTPVSEPASPVDEGEGERGRGATREPA
ncbi:MAG: hypothetical protein IMZ46_14315 [Acidobacteria bacterium]|nr:hypothetical protein [Acidobacteriota bacterium]